MYSLGGAKFNCTACIAGSACPYAASAPVACTGGKVSSSFYIMSYVSLGQSTVQSWIYCKFEEQMFSVKHEFFVVDRKSVSPTKFYPIPYGRITKVSRYLVNMGIV